MKVKSFEYKFSLRAVICFFLVILLLLSGILRVAAINAKNYRLRQLKMNGRQETIGLSRGSILDTNGIPITNSKIKTVAAVMPTPAAIACVKANLSGEERTRVLSLLESGNPAVTTFSERVECEGIAYLNLPVRITENTVAHHLVGYLDGDGNGADGIEAAYDSFLSSKDELAVIFPVDGKGNPLLGTEPEFTGNTDKLSNAVYLTVDVNIQKAVEQAAQGLLSGAVIVSECKTNKIRAMVSLPDFSPDKIEESLNGKNSPLLNKCLMAYNIGSAFKPCIAAAAIKEGMGNTKMNCTGRSVIEKRVFNCHKTSGHGETDLKNAIKNSCNCYFYNLAISLGAEKVYKAAEYMNFGCKIKLAENVYTSSGTIPTCKELKNDSDIANFAIGQGNILLTPVCLLNMYSAIANGGQYYLPSVVEKTSKSGKIKKYDIGKPTAVFDQSTANKLKEALCEVVSGGTGTAAKSDKVTAAGKTATAQTGRFDEAGSEITNSWFCGFFPAESPKYTVVVMSDGEYKKSPAEVFKSISEALTK